MTLTSELVTDIHRLIAKPVRVEVLAAAKDSVLDWLGGVISGSTTDLVTILAAEVSTQGGHPVSTIIPGGMRTSPLLAALVNGSAADAHDYADNNDNMRGHSTPAVVAAALAVSEEMRARGLDFLVAVIAGVEMECRVGLLVDLSRTAFHPTASIAPFGAAAAAATLLNLSHDEWRRALGIAATQAAGLRTSGGTMSKPLHSGSAAMHGILAAKLARRGFVASANALEAPGGFIESRGASARVGDAVAAARSAYLIRDTEFKSYAACTLSHVTIANMLDLRDRAGFAPDEVESIELTVTPVHLRVCNIEEPRTDLEAKFSLRATAAMALLGDDMASLASYSGGNAVRPEVRRLASKISVTARPGLPRDHATASVRLADGRRLKAATRPAGPLRDIAERRARVVRKFMALASPVLGEDAAGNLRDCVLALDAAASVGLLTDACAATARDDGGKRGEPVYEA